MNKIKKNAFIGRVKNTVLYAVIFSLFAFANCDKPNGENEQHPITPFDSCHCIMDTLIGEWSWFKTFGGFEGKTANNRFKSIIKILSQNEDGSVNYEIWVMDTLFSASITYAGENGHNHGIFVENTLFYRGNFQIKENQWNERTANIKLPHDFWLDEDGILCFETDIWIFRFQTTGQSKNILVFIDNSVDGYDYYYQKIK